SARARSKLGAVFSGACPATPRWPITRKDTGHRPLPVVSSATASPRAGATPPRRDPPAGHHRRRFTTLDSGLRYQPAQLAGPLEHVGVKFPPFLYQGVGRM